MKKDHIISYRVYFEDTDMMGIVYHARHLYFFERSRTEMLREHGFSLTVMAQNNIYFAIREAQLLYHLPAYLDDFLNITTSIVKQTACTLQFKQMMYNQHDKLISEAIVLTVCVDQALKPRRLPTQLNGLIGE
jgi:acyl-CoA thioester hydrolase